MAHAPTKYAGIGSDAVRAKTGKGWDEWLETLDAENATTRSHKEIAQMLYDKYKVPAWWCQMVTVGYEQARGTRGVHQKSDGYAASASRTFDAPLGALYQACADDETRAKWLGRKRYTVNKATPNKSLRLAWGKDDANRVDFNLYARGTHKSQIAIEHTKLADAAEVETTKAYWRKALDKLGALLEK